MKTEIEEKKVLENELTLREKIELKEKAYRLALATLMPDKGFKTTAEWVEYKSKEIYRWMITQN